MDYIDYIDYIVLRVPDETLFKEIKISESKKNLNNMNYIPIQRKFSNDLNWGVISEVNIIILWKVEN